MVVSAVATPSAAVARVTVASSCSVSRSAVVSRRWSRASPTSARRPIVDARPVTSRAMPATRESTRITRIPLHRHDGARSTAEIHDDRATMSPVSDHGASPPAERLSPWAPLRHTVFAALFAAQLGSNIGTFFQTVAAAWLMGDLTSSATLVALIQTASLLPFLLLGLPAGALADIFDRRLLLIGTQAWMLLCAVLLAVLTMTDHVTPGTLLALTFALGIGTALMGPAWQAIQPDLVPQREFGQAVALSSLTFNAGRAIGPALGGALVASAGAGWAFVVNAASFLGVDRRAGVVAPAPHQRAAVDRVAPRRGEGRPALRRRTRRRCGGSSCARSCSPSRRRPSRRCCRPSSAIELGLGSGGYGILLGCFGIGAALAAVVRPRLDNMFSSDQNVTASSLVDRRRPRARGDHRLAVGGRAGAVLRRRGMDQRHGDAERRHPIGPAVVGARPRPRAVPRRAGRRDRRSAARCGAASPAGASRSPTSWRRRCSWPASPRPRALEPRCGQGPRSAPGELVGADRRARAGPDARARCW